MHNLDNSTPDVKVFSLDLTKNEDGVRFWYDLHRVACNARGNLATQKYCHRLARCFVAAHAENIRPWDLSATDLLRLSKRPCVAHLSANDIDWMFFLLTEEGFNA